MPFRALLYVEQNYSFAILRPLQEAVLANGGEVAWFLVGEGANRSYINENEKLLGDVLAVKTWQPDVVFVPGNTISKVIPGLKVAVFHGFNAGKLNRKGGQDHFVIRHCFDLYCTQGPSTTIPFLELMNKHRYFRVKETGWSTVDPLFTQSGRKPYVAERINTGLQRGLDAPSGEHDGKKTILFCSTSINACDPLSAAITLIPISSSKTVTNLRLASLSSTVRIVGGGTCSCFISS